LATVNGGGVVSSGTTSGTVNITYTNSNGCSSTSYPITINAAPTVSLSSTLTPSIASGSLCVGGSTLQLYGSATAAASPWSSSNTGIATINSSGLITSVSAGQCNITYTNNNGCTRTITLRVDTLPLATTNVTNGVRCGTGTVSLSATPPTGMTTDWWSASSGGSQLSTGSTSYTTPSISVTTLYYVQTRNTTTGCSSSARTAVTAQISSIGTWLGSTTNWNDASMIAVWFEPNELLVMIITSMLF